MPLELSTYIGRHRRGQRVSLLLWVPIEPDATPQVKVYGSSGTLVKTLRIPRKSANFFAIDHFLDDDYVDDVYVATIRYDVSTVRQPQQFRYFQVVGGSAKGCAIAIHELRRPLGRAVITLNENGTVNMGYNPRVEG